MARCRILYWHHIPSVVEARDKEDVYKEELSQRFQELIDRIAMKNKLVGTDAYLEGWRKGRAEVRAGNAVEVAKAVAAEIEAQYEEIAAKKFGDK
ncbi:MAG: virulence factor [Geminicoccaceae bacterium]|jgi:methionine synthase II (cobalamin-independent)